MGSKNPRLHTNEVLIALSATAANNDDAALALSQLSKLKGCQVHSTVMLSDVDTNIFKRLDFEVTYNRDEFEVKVPSRRLDISIKEDLIEEVGRIYGVDNIDLLGTAVCDGGSEIAEKTYIGMDYINPGMKLLYSRTTGTTVAPLGPDGEMYDFYPLIEFMRKDIRDELPMYTKLFVLSSVGVLMNAPNRIIKGNFRA